MSFYYHGTSKGNKEIISQEGFKIRAKQSSHSLGNYIYFDEFRENARAWGECVIKVELDESKIMTFENVHRLRNYAYSVIDPSEFTLNNDMELFGKYLIENGYIGFKLKTNGSHQGWMVVVCDEKQIRIIG